MKNNNNKNTSKNVTKNSPKNDSMEDNSIDMSTLNMDEILKAAGDIAYEWNLVSDKIVWSDWATDIIGIKDKRIFSSGAGFNARIEDEDLPTRLKGLGECYDSENPKRLDCEYRVRRDDGKQIWIHDRGQAWCDDDGKPLFFRGVLRQVDRRKSYEAELEQLANFDELTGHFNRSHLCESLHQVITHAHRQHQAGAYLAIGIDKLSLINNAFGHVTADAVIMGVGRRLKKLVKSGQDSLGRVGGDIFGIVLSDCKPEEMAAVADRILTSCRDNPIETPMGPVHVSVSVGGVSFPGYSKSAFEAMTRAETALQEAKLNGKDCFKRYQMTDAQKREYRESLIIGEQVKNAIKTDKAVFAYQPIVDTKTGQTKYFEVLLRLFDDKGEMIPAGLFIPAVERLGLIKLVDHYVLKRAIQNLSREPELELAINVSGFTVSDKEWLETCIRLLRIRKDIAERMVVEITETAAMQDLEESTRFVHALRNLGCRVALDDFGAGNTSFRHLRALSVDIVKIDGSFVNDLANNIDNQLFVKSLINIAGAFSLETVAECVETKEEAELLRRYGVDSLQGWYYGRPQLREERDAEIAEKKKINL